MHTSLAKSVPKSYNKTEPELEAESKLLSCSIFLSTLVRINSVDFYTSTANLETEVRLREGAEPFSVPKGTETFQLIEIHLHLDQGIHA